MERNQAESLSPVFAIPPATITADNTPPTVDLQGYQSATLYIIVGRGGITFTGTNKVEFKLTHSDDDSSYSAVAQADVNSAITVGTGGIVRELIAAHAAPTVTEVAYMGRKRYVKLLADFSGTHGTGTPIAALVVRGLPLTAPVA